MTDAVIPLLSELAQRIQQHGLQMDCGSAGSRSASIAVVGEAPGHEEVARKMPFVGGSGRLLWRCLDSIHINRRDVYATNVCKRQLSMSASDRTSRAVVSRQEMDEWETILEWELSQLPNLRYILVLGNVALFAITRLKKINSVRGSVYNMKYAGKEVTVMCTNNPAVGMDRGKGEMIFRFDIAKFGDVVDGSFEPCVIKPFINPTFVEACEWIDEMQHGKRPVSFDIETIANETACIGLSNNGDEGMCISFRKHNENVYTLEEEAALYRRFQRLFAAEDVRFVAQNGSFDSTWLGFKDRIIVPKVWFDTLLAHHTLYPTLPHNLGFLTAQYTNHPFYKDEKDAWREGGGHIDEFWEYNVKDICITYRVYECLLRELEQEKLDLFFFNHVMRLQPHLVHMTLGGVLCDVEYKNKIAASLEKDLEVLEDQFVKLAQDATGMRDLVVNPRSPKQLAQLFFTHLRLVGHGTSTNAANRKRMRDHAGTSKAAQEMLTVLDKYKEEQKFFSTYAASNIDEDGRFRCEYKQYGTQAAPGRLSSGQLLWGTGTNLQNQPKRAYPMFCADPGYVFVYFDLAQAEARVVAWRANISKWKEQFERARLEGGYDAHRALASEMFNVPYDEVPKKDFDANGVMTIRFIAKRCRHGLNYRMGPERLAETTGLPLREAHRNYNLYHAATPELRVWWDEETAIVRATRCLYNAYGRRLIILDDLSRAGIETEEALKSIIAFYPQSSIGDKVSRVIYKSHEDKDWPTMRSGSKVYSIQRQARVSMNIHDALIALVRPQDVEQVAAVMKKHAEEPLIVKGEECIIPAEFKVSTPDEHGVHRWSTLD